MSRSRLAFLNILAAIVGVGMLIVTVQRAGGWTAVVQGVATVGWWFTAIVVLGAFRMACRARAWMICANNPQLRFSDADPWHLRIDNGSTAAPPGAVDNADVVLESTWEDWLNVSAKSVADPRRLLLSRRIRPKGSPRSLLRLMRIFPPRPAKLG